MHVPEPSGKIPDFAVARSRAHPAPLDLPRLVMRRAAWVAAAGVLLMLLLGLARVRDDVDDELAGARPLAELAEQLSTLASLDDAPARLALQRWAAGLPPRHLRVSVTSAQGELIVAAGPQPALHGLTGWLARLGDGLFTPAPPFTVAWALPRPSGQPWAISLSAAPESEHLEALANLWEGVLWLAAVAIGLLLAMAWNSRRAFAPLAALLAAIADLQTPARSGQPRAMQRMRPLPSMPIAELETLAGALRGLDEALAQAQAQRQHLAQQVLSLQEDERARLARELHDEFGQRLTALRVNAAWLARRCADQPELLPVVQDMAGQCALIQQDIRAVLARLRPLASLSSLAGPGSPSPQAEGWASLAELGEALAQLVASWGQAQAGARPVSLELSWQAAQAQADLTGEATAETEAALLIPQHAALALYRITQEALTNIARHSQASRALVRLQVLPQPQAGNSGQAKLALAWAVQDDGIGLAQPSSAFHRGNGLAGLRERLWALGSELHISPALAQTATERGWAIGNLAESNSATSSMAEGAAAGTLRPGCRLSAQLWLPCQRQPSAPAPGQEPNP